MSGLGVISLFVRGITYRHDGQKLLIGLNECIELVHSGENQDSDDDGYQRKLSRSAKAFNVRKDRRTYDIIEFASSARSEVPLPRRRMISHAMEPVAAKKLTQARVIVNGV